MVILLIWIFINEYLQYYLCSKNWTWIYVYIHLWIVSSWEETICSVHSSHLFNIVLYIWLENGTSCVLEKWPVTFNVYCRLPDVYGRLSTSDWALGIVHAIIPFEPFLPLPQRVSLPLHMDHCSAKCLRGTCTRLAGVPFFCHPWLP